MDVETTELSMEEIASAAAPAPRSHANRKPGHHVTDLVREAAVMAKVGVYRGESLPGLAAMGRAWEGVVCAWMRQTVPGFVAGVEVERDGVTGNLDGLIYEEGASRVFEVKLKFSGYRELELDWKWMKQVEAYCAMTESGGVDLVVGYIGARPPSVRVYRHSVEVSEEAREGTWGMLMNIRERMEKGV